MNAHFKTTTALLLALVMVFALAACSKTESGSNASPTTQQNTTDKSDGADTAEPTTRVITDALGRQVEIPVEVKSIVPLGNTPRMISYLGLADIVVGIEECEIASSPIQAYAYPHVEKWSALPNCGTNSMGETAYYPEQIMLANPDVILTTDNGEVADNLQTQTGLPVVCVDQGSLFAESYEQSLRILADVCGVTDRAETLIAYLNGCLKDLADRSANIDISEKPTVLGAGATFKGGHSIDGVYTNYAVFEILEANDVAEEIAGQKGSSGVMVEKEQILAWDPEIIFFDSGSMGLVRADYAENAGYFEQLQAVRKGELYQWPNSTWHWSNVEIPLVSAYYVGCMLYPERFSDVDFEEKASDIFEMFLGEPDYLEVINASGSGYGKVTLGE